MIVIGSRGSQLALWQARHIAGCLQELGVETRLEIIKTTGDKITDVPLAQVGGKGLFTKEIEEALLAGAIDLAVHSLKDMPTGLPGGSDARGDSGARRSARCVDRQAAGGVGRRDRESGTSSLRRAAQLHALGRGLVIENLRGNVDTRLRKLDEGHYDAIVLAAAGLRRLGWAERIRELIDVEVMCPAAGQGALAIETRDDGGAGHEIARKLDHAATNAAVTAERALLATLEGGCQVPIGAHARFDGGVLHLMAVVASPDGARVMRDRAAGPRRG